jgi:hypothetical protein
VKDDHVAKTWEDLQLILYNIERTEHGRYRSNYVYRGVDDKSYGLESSLQRIGSHFASIEGSLLRNFLKYAGPQDVPSDSLLAKLAVAQHHGLPTRVLDWTTAPRVAAHFATSNERLYDKDGAIWCIDIAAVRSLLPKHLHAILDRERAFVFSIEMLEAYKTLDQFDQLLSEREFVLFFEPPSLDARIINQGAMLSIMPSPTLDLKLLLQQPEWAPLFKRVIIPKELKWEVRDKLDQDNVTERMLFPGLDGTSRWLRRYYGRGPSMPSRTSIDKIKA